MTREQDASLIARAVDGDESAFSELYDTHRPNVVGIVRRRIGDPDVAEDLVQQTFIRAFGSLDRFRAESAFSTWITRIAINVCLSHGRSEQTRRSYLDLLTDLEYAKSALSDASRWETPEDVLSRAERREILIGGINALPEKYRRAMWLRYVKDRSYEEITQTLEVPMGTVKTWLRRARQQLGRDFRNLNLQRT